VRGRIADFVKIEKIEVPHFEGAVVGAVPRADAAVVDHVVEALGTVLVACTGQTFSQGAFSHCMQGRGCSTTWGSFSSPV